jgi:LPXTG-motif cell wall-anchored protein
MLKHTAQRIAAATIAGGVLAVSPMVLPAAQAAPATGCPAYAVQSTTTTTLTLSPAGPYAVGDAITATADVTVDGTGAPATNGSVTFRYGGTTKTVALSGGSASFDFTAKRGRIPISATFSGECLAGSVANGTSRDRAPVVAGVSATAGGGNGNGNGGNGGNVAGVSGSGGNSGVAGLAATGLDTQTELYGLLGLGLVTVGGLTLVVRRRRVEA